jgi:hypothetical protein
VATEPSKVAAVNSWPVPRNAKQLRGFFGTHWVLQEIHEELWIDQQALTQLLKKGEHFQWTPNTQEAFEVLKAALSSAPILSIPNFEKTFIIETDASDKGMGAVLMQDGHPISFLSKAFCPRN